MIRMIRMMLDDSWVAHWNFNRHIADDGDDGDDDDDLYIIGAVCLSVGHKSDYFPPS